MFMSRKLATLVALGVLASAADPAHAQRRGAERQPGTQPGAQPGVQPGVQPGAQNQNADPLPGAPDRNPQSQRPVTPDNANPQRPFTQDQTTGTGGFVLATQVVGLPVQSSDGQQIGTMADVLLTVHVASTATAPAGTTEATTGTNAPATAQTTGTQQAMGTSIFALINVDAFAEGRVAIFPWELLHYADGVFVIGFDVNRLSEVPSVMQGDPRMLQGREWTQQVDEFFQDDLRQIRAARPDLENLAPDQQPTTPRQPGLNRPEPTPGTPPRTPGNQSGTTPPPRTSRPGATPDQPGTTPQQPGAAPGASNSP